MIWSETTDYQMPPSLDSTYNVTLSPSNKVYAAGAGGKLFYRDDADAKDGVTKTIAFYGDSVYSANKTALDAAIVINTPITVDANNNVYFDLPRRQGILLVCRAAWLELVRMVKEAGSSTAKITNDVNIAKVATNSAIAVSRDGKTIYVLANNNFLANTRQTGSLLALDSSTLALKNKVQ